MATFIKVACVKGRSIAHPETIGRGVQQRIAHTRNVIGDTVNAYTGEPAELREFIPSKEPALIDAKHGEYIRRAIADGDLQYIAHVTTDAAGTVLTSTRDPYFEAAVTKSGNLPVQDGAWKLAKKGDAQ